MSAENSYKSMMSKTGIQIIGMLRAKNVYVSKTLKQYHSIDLDITGTKLPVNVRLPELYVQPENWVEGELCKLIVSIVPTFDRKGIELMAVSA